MLRSRALRSVALVVGALTSVSCGDFTRSTTPAAGGAAGLSLPTKALGVAFTYLGENAKAKAVRWAASHEAVEERVSSMVGQEGGSLSLPGSDFTMNIPEGALSVPTLITITSKGGPHVAYDMQPHGLVFGKAVTIVQQLRHTATYGTTEGNGIRSAYLSDGNEAIGADDTATPAELVAGMTFFQGSENVAETHVWYLNHFSRYILISGVWELEPE